MSVGDKISAIDSPKNISIILGSINGANGGTYSRHTVEALQNNNHLVVFSHWRNCNWCEDREPRSFQTFTDTEDVDALIQHVHSKFPKANIFLVGMSMGGQMMLRWTAKNNVSSNSPPFNQ
jgi:predicted alpha/beta-fold hydrolase